jgi:hypothetical protein
VVQVVFYMFRKTNMAELGRSMGDVSAGAGDGAKRQLSCVISARFK